MKINKIARICLAVFIFCAALGLGNKGAVLFSLPALLIVFSGTLAALLLSFPWVQIKGGFLVAVNTLTSDSFSESEKVQNLLETCFKARLEGVLKIENSPLVASMPLLRSGLEMSADGHKEEDMISILNTENQFFQSRRRDSERIFRFMARTAPSFGVVGSVAGLVGMVAGIADQGVILNTIPLALISTLYGILISQFLFVPFAEMIQTRTRNDMMASRMILECLISIMRGESPHLLERRLQVYMTPSLRSASSDDCRALRQKYILLSKQNQTATLSSQTAD